MEVEIEAERLTPVKINTDRVADSKRLEVPGADSRVAGRIGVVREVFYISILIGRNDGSITFEVMVRTVAIERAGHQMNGDIVRSDG